MHVILRTISSFFLRQKILFLSKVMPLKFCDTSPGFAISNELLLQYSRNLDTWHFESLKTKQLTNFLLQHHAIIITSLLTKRIIFGLKFALVDLYVVASDSVTG